MVVVWLLLLVAHLGRAAKPAIFARDAEKMRLYDFSCKESQKHACACQLQCSDAKKCSQAVAVCGRYAECAYVVMNNGGDWATLKRVATREEMAQIQGYPEKTWTHDDLESNKPRLSQAGADRVGNWTARGGFARLLHAGLESAAAETTDAPLCGSSGAEGADKLRSLLLADRSSTQEPILGLVALSYKTPGTLRHAVHSWAEYGLLEVVDERILLLNDPTPAEAAVGYEYGFQVETPDSLGIKFKRGHGGGGSSSSMHGQAPFDLKAVKPNVMTIGTAFAAAMVVSKAKYVLFLEKDFALDKSVSRATLADELVASAIALERGAAMIRLRAITDQGCGTFRRCENNANMPDWRAQQTFGRRRNWWSFYCRDFAKEGSVADCAANDQKLLMRCFTSWDSNWSLNAVMVPRDASLSRRWTLGPGGNRRGGPSRFARGATIAEYGAEKWDTQDGFEVGMLADDWGRLNMPICLSQQGLFTHVEIDG